MSKNSSTPCPRCEGSGQCVECKGTGQVVCVTCDGKGEGTTPRGLAYTCKTCNGTGHMACDKLCSSCEGTGAITDALQRKIHAKYVPRFANTTPLSKVTNVLFALNVVMFIVQQVPGVQNALIPPIYGNYSEVWRFFTPMFMHGGIMHLAFNSWFLLKYCPQLEGLYGSGRFLALYVFSGVCSSLLSLWLTPFPGYGIGASGALFGVAMTYVALHYRWGMFDREEMTRWWIFMAAYLGLGFASQLAGVGLPFVGSVDNWGHLGGGLGGFLFAWLSARPMGR